MAGFDDITKKATEFLNRPETKEALKGDKAEEVSDKLLDGVAGIANKVTGGKHADKIADAKKQADEKIGNEQSGDHRPASR